MLERRRPRHSGHGVPAEPLTLAPFLNLARELSALFVPVNMRPAFREELEASLLAAAGQQSARRTLTIDPAARDRYPQSRVDDASLDRRWVVGAAVGSAVSIASIVAIVWRYRSKAA